ncbi:MAG TPA: hypothetical protein VH351_21710 [Bryobacteraceae bacterium]|nr:hypothetical protein [Bryobacteraceae bacterium]
MNKTAIAIVIFVAAFVALIAYSTLGGPKYRVELCMTYKGQTACKTVSAKSEKGALENAITGACADIASGVTDTMNCTQSQPQSTKWLSRPDGRQ